MGYAGIYISNLTLPTLTATMGASPSFPVVSLSRERTAVVTGGNTGIGYEAAKHLAMMGATVIIACRSEERAKHAIQRMNEEYQQAKTGGQLQEGHIREESLPVEFMKLDLSSLKSTMQFIQDFKSSGRKLHLLLCNAGIALVPLGHTEDGFEQQFQVNYLGHFLIVAHLLPVMKTSGPDCRILFTSSYAHKMARFDLEKAQAKNPADYARMRYYGNSKLHQIQHMFSLTRRLSGTGICVTSMHPGGVDTEITRNYEDLKCLHSLSRCFASISRGNADAVPRAVTLIDAAVNPQKKGVTGVYLVDCRSASLSAAARNETFQEDLWKYSLECLKDYLPESIVSSLEGELKQTLNN